MAPADSKFEARGARPMPLLTAAQMRAIDRATIDERGIAGERLMEEAGRAVWQAIQDLVEPESVVILAGKGNNGGDGLVVAREAHAAGARVALFLLADPAELKGEALHHFEALPAAIRPERRATTAEIREGLTAQPDVVVDALLGIGVAGSLRGEMAEVVDAVNELRAGGVKVGWRPAVVAVDIPTGLPAEPGIEFGAAIQADVTVTFGAPKIGLVVEPGIRLSGRVICERLSFPDDLFRSADIKTYLLTPEYIGSLLPPRRADGHKGTFGNCLVLGGSRGFAGAPVLMAQGALRSGVGLVFAAVPGALAPALIAAEPAALTKPLGAGDAESWSAGIIDELPELAPRTHAIAAGPGMGTDAPAEEALLRLIETASGPLLLDADALTILARRDDAAKLLEGASVAMTPHPGEMARLLGEQDAAAIQADRFGTARRAAERFGATVLLKGAQSLIASPDGDVLVNPTGNSGLAKGGSGDLLAGLAAGLAAQGLDWTEALCAAAFLHGLAADLALADKQTAYSLTHRDVLAQVGPAFASVLEAAGAA